MSVGVSGPASDLVGDLDQELRAVVRRERVDPQLESARVRRLAEEVVRAHDERSLTGVVAPVPDPVGVVGELVARVSGFGPLQPFLDDPEVEEIWINDPSRVFIARNGRHELTNVILSRAEVQELVERMLKSSGRRIDLSQPFVDAMLPQGHRLHVVLEGISREFAAVNIRKFVLKAARLTDLVRLGSMPPQAARFLEAAVLAGQNIVVAGGTQAGKTTMLNCLAAAIPGGDRIISAEEVFELRFSHPDWVPMQTRQAGLEGTGEVLAARPRARDAPDAADPDHRRRGPGGRVPRPAAGAERGAARDGDDPRQQRARGAGQAVHAAAAGRREHLRAVRRTHRRELGRPRRPPRARQRRRTTGQRDRRRPRAGRERHRRDRAGLRPAGRRPRARRRNAHSARLLRARRHRRTPDPAGATTDGRRSRAAPRSRAAADLVRVLGRRNRGRRRAGRGSVRC